MCQQCAKRLRVQLLTNDDAGRTSTLKVLVAVLIRLATCKCDDLCSDICTQLLLARAALDIDICSDLAVLKSYKLKRDNICSLMQ